MIRRLSLIFICLLIINCYQLALADNSIVVYFEQPFSLQLNQIGLEKSEQLKIKFLQIKEDSRCPVNDQCIWEGQVEVVINIIKDNKNLGNFSLIERAGQSELAIKNSGEYSIKLIEVMPRIQKNISLNIADYRIILVISKALKNNPQTLE